MIYESCSLILKLKIFKTLDGDKALEINPLWLQQEGELINIHAACTCCFNSRDRKEIENRGSITKSAQLLYAIVLFLNKCCL